jgi:hypothetical protein
MLLHQIAYITLLASNLDCYKERRLTQRRERKQLTAR